MVVIGLSMGVLSYAVTQLMVQPALPVITDAVGAATPDGSWLISSLLVSTAVCTPLLGQLGDVLGRSRVLVAVLLVAGLGSILAMTASSLGQIIAGRVLQGVGGAAFPLAFGQARALLPPARVPVAIGLISGGFGVGGTIGVILAGPLTDAGSWRWLFAVGLLFNLVPIPFVLRTRTADTRSQTRNPDWLGAATVAIGLTATLLAISEGAALGWLRFGLPVGLGGVVILLLWGRRSLRQANPMLDIRMLVNPRIWPGFLVAGFLGLSMYPNSFLIPLFVQDEDGLASTVTAAGISMMPGLLIGILGGYFSGKLARFGGMVPLIVGSATMVVGYGSILTWHDTLWQLTIGVAISHGFGMNVVYAGIAHLATTRAPHGRSSEAAGVNTTVLSVGGSIGSQVAALIITSAAFSGADGFFAAFGLLAVFMSTSAIFAGAMLLKERRAAR
jgi:MFS family permease